MRSSDTCTDPGVAWLADKSADICPVCKKEFGLLKRRPRHHCRSCGYIFCGDCCPVGGVVTQTSDVAVSNSSGSFSKTRSSSMTGVSHPAPLDERQCLWCSEVPRWIQPTYYSEDLGAYDTAKKGLATVSVRTVMDSYARRTVLGHRDGGAQPNVTAAPPQQHTPLAAPVVVGSMAMTWPVPRLPSGPMLKDVLCRRTLLWMQPQPRLYLSCCSMHIAATFYVADPAFEPLRYHRSIQDVLPMFHSNCRTFGRGAYGAVHLFKPSPDYHKHCSSEYIVLKIVKKLVVRGPGSDDEKPQMHSRAFQRRVSTDGASSRCEMTWLQSLTEIQMLGTIHHENVAGLVDAFQTRDSIVIVQEAGDGGSLWAARRRLRDSGGHVLHLAAHTAKHVAAGLRCMYEDHGIIHRDLKPENIVLSKDLSRVMIIDLGFARFVTPRDDEELKHFNNCGTPGFAPPEVIQWVVARRPTTASTGYALHQGDLFSLGVILFMLVADCPTPFSVYYPEHATRLPNGLCLPLKKLNKPRAWQESLDAVKEGIRATAAEFRGGRDDSQLYAGFRELLQGLLAWPYTKRWRTNQILENTFVQRGAVGLLPTIQNLANDIGNEVREEAEQWDMCEESVPMANLDAVVVAQDVDPVSTT